MPDTMTIDQVAGVLGPIGTAPTKPWFEKDFLGRVACLSPEVCDQTIVWEPIVPIGGHILFEVARRHSFNRQEWRLEQIVAMRFLNLPHQSLFEKFKDKKGDVPAHIILNVIGNELRRTNPMAIYPLEIMFARTRMWLERQKLLVPQSMWI